jgi:hypothetical protein
MPERYVVISQQGDDATTIKSLGKKFDGDLRTFGNVFGEVIGATEAIEHDLWKRGMQAMEATRLAYFMAGCRVGAIHHVPEADMRYRILKADFTSDRKPIVPNLEVLDYDRRTGIVEPGQFMDDGMMRPGGEYFDGWYEVIPDGKAGRGKRFNGERMRSL